ncbi:MAG TPA: cupredoxin family copper-binding protein [Thermomicrobiales bacterium]|nr:cupredoxin family copper-binding protein [Thermomicrobiales bacterium]
MRLPSRWPVTILIMTLAVCLAAAGFLSPVDHITAHQVATVDISVVDFAFEPATVSIPAGVTVIWTNNGSRPHTVTADDGSFDSGRLDPGEQFSQTFDQPGTFTYHCGFHPEMLGSIVVTESAEPAGASDEATPAAAESATSDQAAGSDTAGPVRNLDPAESSRLAHIHAGTCEELGIVVYSFPDIETFRLDEGEEAGVGAIELITGTTQTPLSALFGEPFSVHVHESAQNKQTYIACSDIGSRPGDPWTETEGLTLRAIEQNGSGYSGFTTLRPTADGGTQVSIAIAASSAATEAAAAQPAPPPSTTYTSPTYGYTIGYGPMWEESENISADGRDRLVLFNGTSYITFTGAREFGGDPQACVDDFVAELTADPNVGNLGLATDEEGNPLEGGTAATGAYAVYSHDYTFADRVEPYTLFVGCVPLIPNEAVLAIVQNVPTEEYNEQVELREALLRGLTLNQ